MRITTQSPSIDFTSQANEPQIKTTTNSPVTKELEEVNSSLEFVEEQQPTNEDLSDEKVQQVVKSLNEFMQTNSAESKFVFHEGLNKYYVQMVDKETKEVVKEIPSKKILDAFYEMQKLVGMIVDEKI